MNSAERETDAGKITKERFLKDLRPILDEALEKRVGVTTVELFTAEGGLHSYFERLRIGVPRVTRLEITPNSLEVSEHVPEKNDWDRTNVFFGSLNEGEVPGFCSVETNAPIKVLKEAEWERVLKKAKDVLTFAVSGQLKESESSANEAGRQRAGGTSEDQNLIQEYDKLFNAAIHASSWETSTFPSELYPRYEFKGTLVFGDNNAQEVGMQSFSLKEEGVEQSKPLTRLLKVNNDRGLFGSVLIRDFPAEVKWFDHVDKHSGTPLTDEEKAQVLESARNVFEGSKHSEEA